MVQLNFSSLLTLPQIVVSKSDENLGTVNRINRESFSSNPLPKGASANKFIKFDIMNTRASSINSKNFLYPLVQTLVLYVSGICLISQLFGVLIQSFMGIYICFIGLGSRPHLCDPNLNDLSIAFAAN